LSLSLFLVSMSCYWYSLVLHLNSSVLKSDTFATVSFHLLLYHYVSSGVCWWCILFNTMYLPLHLPLPLALITIWMHLSVPLFIIIQVCAMYLLLFIDICICCFALTSYHQPAILHELSFQSVQKAQKHCLGSMCFCGTYSTGFIAVSIKDHTCHDIRFTWSNLCQWQWTNNMFGQKNQVGIFCTKWAEIWRNKLTQHLDRGNQSQLEEIFEIKYFSQEGTRNV